MKHLIIYLLLFLSSCTSYSTIEKYDYKFEEVKKTSDIAMKKIKYNVKEEKSLKNDKDGFIYWLISSDLEIKFKPLNNSTIVQMISSDNRVPTLVNDVIKQELTQNYGNRQLKSKKSFWLALLLNCISPSFGSAYEQYRNPYHSKNSYLLQLIGGFLLYDVFYTWLLGTDFGKDEFDLERGVKWRWIIPAVMIPLSPFMYIRIKKYNNLVESGYSFRF